MNDKLNIGLGGIGTRLAMKESLGRDDIFCIDTASPNDNGVDIAYSKWFDLANMDIVQSIRNSCCHDKEFSCWFYCDNFMEMGNYNISPTWSINRRLTRASLYFNRIDLNGRLCQAVENKSEINIFTSSFGGTGSGIILDVAYFIKKIDPSLTLKLNIIIPGRLRAIPFQKFWIANSYACVSELAHCQSMPFKPLLGNEVNENPFESYRFGIFSDINQIDFVGAPTNSFSSDDIQGYKDWRKEYNNNKLLLSSFINNEFDTLYGVIN